MLSPADILIIGAAALIFFGPEQLPRVARKVGHAVRDVQMTSQSFIREMERAADEADFAAEARARVEHAVERPPAEHVEDPPSSVGERADQHPQTEASPARATDEPPVAG